MKKILSGIMIAIVAIFGLMNSIDVNANSDEVLILEITDQMVYSGFNQTIDLRDYIDYTNIISYDYLMYYKRDSTLNLQASKRITITDPNDYTIYIDSDGGQDVDFEIDSDSGSGYFHFNSSNFGQGDSIQFKIGNIQRNVNDNQRPAITGEENFVTNVDDAKPVSFFQSYLYAYDETDGDLTDQIYIITDNYTANKSVLGAHMVTFGVKDNSNNEATLDVYIRVVDITKPIITGNASVASIGYKETWNISNYKATLQVSDNYDSLTHSDIVVKTDGYTANKNKLGTYTVVFAVKDNSNNEGTFSKQVKVIDNVKPNFSGPTTIATSNNTILTESDIRAQLTASDEIDGNITSRIELVTDNYTGKGNKVGSYTITYRVSDNAGNTAEHVVTITRSDKIPPVFWVEDGVSIKTTPTTPLNFEQIINILDATNQVTINATTTFTTLFNDYAGNEDAPGVYTWGIKARSIDGNESEHYMSITVLDIEDEDGVDVTPEFDFVLFIEENATIIIIGVLIIATVAVLVFRRKRK